MCAFFRSLRALLLERKSDIRRKRYRFASGIRKRKAGKSRAILPFKVPCPLRGGKIVLNGDKFLASQHSECWTAAAETGHAVMSGEHFGEQCCAYSSVETGDSGEAGTGDGGLTLIELTAVVADVAAVTETARPRLGVLSEIGDKFRLAATFIVTGV